MEYQENNHEQSETIHIPRRRWLRSLVAGVLILCSGMAIGSGITIAFFWHKLQQFVHQPEGLPGHIVRHLASRLDLSKEQEKELEKIFQRCHRSLQSIREEAHPKIQRQLEETRREIMDILTEEQAAQFNRRFNRLRRLWMPPPPRPFRDF